MYHRTRKKILKDAVCAKMRDGKDRRRQELAAELGPRTAAYVPPKLRRVVIVIDFDLGAKVDVFKLFRTGRIDSYRIEHNGRKIDGRLGWANFCKRLSAHFPRILSPHAE